MPDFPDEPPSGLDLIARAREGDERAFDILNRRYVNLMRRWARTRLASAGVMHTDSSTDDSIERLVRGATRNTMRQLTELRIQREATLLVAVRDAVRERMSSLNHTPDVLEVTMGAQTAREYEQCLQRLQPVHKEAVVSVLEFQRSFEELADGLNIPSVERACKEYKEAIVQLAEEMGHGR